jgi:hypothetical protein
METLPYNMGFLWGAIAAEMGLENEVVYVVNDDPIRAVAVGG